MRRHIVLSAGFLGVLAVGCWPLSPRVAQVQQEVDEATRHALVPPSWLRREVDGFEVRDFSQHPKHDSWFSKSTLVEPGAPTKVISFALDEDRLWFAHRSGVGAYELGSQEIIWYGVENGIPGEPTGGVCVTPLGEVYAATERGLARYDRSADCFKRIDDGRIFSVNHRAMEVDGEGRLWLLGSEGAGSVSIYDGQSWKRFRQPMGGVTRDAEGLIWLTSGGRAEDATVLTLIPGTMLCEKAKPAQWADSVPFVDSLNRLFLLECFRDRARLIEWERVAGEPFTLPARKRSFHEESGLTDPESWRRVVIDYVNRELWVAENNQLVNDTRRGDTQSSDGEFDPVPLPPNIDAKWNVLCALDAEHIFLGADDGMYFFDGRSWSRIRRDICDEVTTAPNWPAWPRSYGDSCPLYRYEHARRIEVCDFPGERVTSGMTYEIIEREREFWLLEELPDGRQVEYQFQPPFRYGPHVLFMDYEGYVWAAGTHYLYRFDGSSITTLTAEDHEYFSNDHIYGFAADPHGNVWIGAGGGLALFRDGEFVPPPGCKGALYVHYDRLRDRLIVSTSWNGFHIQCQNECRHFRLPYDYNGRHDQMVRSISVAEDGTIWLATNGGAVSFSEASRRWVKYGNEFTRGIILDDPDCVYVDANPRYVLKRTAAQD